jgi:hypothetical protein
MNLTNIDEESDCESVNGEAFANDTKRLEEGIELQSISSIAYRSNHRPVNYVIGSLRYVGFKRKILILKKIYF